MTNIYSIKKITGETVIETQVVRPGVTIEIKFNGINWAVVDASGEYVKENGHYSVFSRKSTAQQVAANYNNAN